MLLIRQTCGIASLQKCAHAASTLAKGRFMRQWPPGKGVLAASGPRKGPPMRHRFRENLFPRLAIATGQFGESASSNEEAAIWSPGEGRQGAKSGRKTAASLPHDYADRSQNVACLLGFCGFCDHGHESEQQKRRP